MNKYSASIATAAFAAITLAHGQSLGRSSFSSSMIASAMSKFHGVKAPTAPHTSIVATSVKVEMPPKREVTVVAPAVKAVSVVVTTQSAIKDQKPVLTSPPKPSATTASPYRAKNEVQVVEVNPAEIARMVGGPFVDPNAIAVEMPAPVQPGIDLDNSNDGDGSGVQKGTRNLQIKWVEEGFFDAGYEKLIGTFTDQAIRYGIRYGDDDLHMYVKNETLDTVGTGLPYPQAVTGTSVGIEARHWFPGNKMYIVASIGDGVAGLNQGKTDVRYGAAGYTSWRNDRWNADFYGELFYIALATDTFFDWRLRAGRIWQEYKDHSYLWGYWVGQFWISGQTESGTENRMEFGPGIGYMFRDAVSVNFEFRAGYAYRTGIDASGEKVYWNPTLIIAGGFYKGWP